MTYDIIFLVFLHKLVLLGSEQIFYSRRVATFFDLDDFFLGLHFLELIIGLIIFALPWLANLNSSDVLLFCPEDFFGFVLNLGSDSLHRLVCIFSPIRKLFLLSSDLIQLVLHRVV